jgi:thiosulfate dehydrogenase [quinone] large subunit
MGDVVRPWWALLPLRLFLGVTFTYAGLSKLWNPGYLDGSSPSSVQQQILALQHQSPIGFLLGWSAHAPTLVGVLIAVGELSVGLATLAGLLVRIAAAGGFALATTFFLTVSWHTHPYFYGSDIVFMAAWTVPLLLGSWGGPSLDAFIARHAAADADPDRRRLVLGAGAVGGMALLTGAAAAVAAAAAHGRRASSAAPGPSSPSPAPTKTHRSQRQQPTQPSGRVIAQAAQVAPGSAVSFTDNSGTPALLVHETSGEFRAFSAVCTHAGCLVGYQSGDFFCPCHGGRYSGLTGAVIAGPPPTPLQQVQVSVSNGEVFLT